MANALAVGNVLKGSVWCADGDQASVNTFYYRVTAVGGSPATDADFANQLDSAVQGPYPAILNNNARYRGVQGQIIFPLPVKVSTAVTSAAANGSSGAVPLPRQSSGLISWKTNLAGRHFRGRTYVPFPATASDTGDGVPTAGYITALSTLATAVLNLTALAAGGRTATVALCVWDRKNHTTTDIIRSVSSNAWATQRRRGSYGRQNVAPI